MLFISCSINKFSSGELSSLYNQHLYGCLASSRICHSLMVTMCLLNLPQTDPTCFHSVAQLYLLPLTPRSRNNKYCTWRFNLNYSVDYRVPQCKLHLKKLHFKSLLSWTAECEVTIPVIKSLFQQSLLMAKQSRLLGNDWSLAPQNYY